MRNLPLRHEAHHTGAASQIIRAYANGHLMTREEFAHSVGAPTVERSRRIGIEVDGVRPIWQRIIVEWPDGTIPAEKWDNISPEDRMKLLFVEEET